MERTPLYSTLPSINSTRLIRLHPVSPGGNLLACDLIVVDDYKAAPPYEALSYCWGDPLETVELLCNGQPVQVTKNLHAALFRLCIRSQLKLVWADALCINQTDTLERNLQLSIMKQIYSQSSHILVWLGHGGENEASVLNLIRRIAYGCFHELYGPAKAPSLWFARLDQEPNKSQAVMKYSHVKLQEEHQANWELLWEFYQLHWFFRVWVIQEVQKSQHVLVLYGQEEIEWTFVALVANWVFHIPTRYPKKNWLYIYFPTLDGFRNAYFMWEQPFCTRSDAPFLALLDLVRHFRSTDPRDKVFALLQYPVRQLRMRECTINMHPLDPSNKVSLTSKRI
jgi:Heterokaryon incompatibility protein (HET)